MTEIPQYHSFDTPGTCIIVPTVNNEKTLGALLKKLLQFTERIIVVNDGSTDSTSQILDSFPGSTVINFPVNK